MVDGIYTLANDVVYDQLVALLNSIEANAGQAYPVCVVAYNQQLDRVRAEVDRRPNVTLLEDAGLFQTWEDFSYEIWKTHPTALDTWKAQGVTTRFYRVGENHRYVAFDDAAPFDRFIYIDADALVMGPLQPVFEALDDHDVAIYDFQFKDIDHIFNAQSPRLKQLFSEDRLGRHIFCSGFFGARRDVLPPERRQWLLQELAKGDAEVLYLGAPNQSVLNYMVHKSQLRVENLVHRLPPDRVTGNSVTSKHFQAKEHLLYDKGAQLTFLHFIGVSSRFFRRLCAGENLDLPYRDIFLHYRYLHEPAARPVYRGKPEPCERPPSPWQRLRKKVGLT
jgi:hypothetical protein